MKRVILGIGIGLLVVVASIVIIISIFHKKDGNYQTDIDKNYVQQVEKPDYDIKDIPTTAEDIDINEQYMAVGDIDEDTVNEILGEYVEETESETESWVTLDELFDMYKIEEDGEEEVVTETENTEESSTSNELESTEEVVEDSNQTSIPQIVKSMIIDTDFASDADDILAIRMALCYQDLGMIDVKGIALSTAYSRSPSAIHALCHYDGYGNIPVAMDTSGNSCVVHTEYVNVMYERAKSRDDYEQPVQMYRRLLSESEGKINIVTLGFLQNIQDLMNSKPDAYSPLTGAELIQEKVGTLYIVGGSDNGRPSFNFWYGKERSIKAAQAVAKNFPGNIVWLPTDLSHDTFCGQFYNNEDKKKKDIVTNALISNNQSNGVVAWDVFSVWCAVQDIYGLLPQYDINKIQGNWYVSDTGASQWIEDVSGLRWRLEKTKYGGDYNAYLNGILHNKFINGTVK